MKTKKTPYYKIAFTFLVLSLTTHLVNGQEIVEKKNGGKKQSDYLFASAGISFPVGYINDSKVSAISAHAGPVLSLVYHHFFNERWGMGLVANGSIYKSKSVTTVSSAPYYFSTTSNPTKSFLKGQLYISASYSLLLKQRMSFDIIQGVGILYMQKPEYDYNYNSISTNHRSSESGWNSGYNIGIKSRFLLKENIGFTAGVNYFYALGLRSNTYLGFNSLDCELGIVFNLNKSSVKK